MKLLKKNTRRSKKNEKKYSEDEINWLITCHQTNSRSTYKQISAMFEVSKIKKYLQVLLVK